MQTSLTLQEAKEKFPKFYQSPHLWIGAIDVECIKSYHDLPVPKSSAYKGAGHMAIDVKGRTYPFTVEHLAWHREIRSEDYYIPLFKPQEGERFIKDLEDAVSAGIGGEPLDLLVDDGYDVCFQTTGIDGQIQIRKENLNIILSGSLSFDTAAYVDHLREKGYYV